MTRKKPNYELKAKVIENGCCKFARKYSLSLWKLEQTNEETSEKDLAKILNHINRYGEELTNYSEEELKEAEKVNCASYKRTKRLKDRIDYILQNKDAKFLTLTFTDEILESTTSETRRRYITRFLKSQCSLYVANIDFGGKNGREHYHAVVIPLNAKIDGKDYREKCGSIDFKNVWHKSNEETMENSSKRLSKYVNKLTNHAIKETTKQNRIIYSKF